jgi:hypothetical protein
MLKEYKRNTNIGVGVGWVVMLLGSMLARSSGGATLLSTSVLILGAVLFIWGCGQYAKGKGHSVYLGALGLLWLLGLVILALMEDKHKDGK